MNIKTLSVSDVNNYIKRVIDNDFILNNTSVKGEISNFKLHSSGHAYFSLKDSLSKINCVMFRSYAQNLKFKPEDGMQVVVKGRVSLYTKEGTYQLYCEDIQSEGLGELYISFEKLKSKLEREGLFDIKYKKPIPRYSKRIGVITSPTGAAIRDIINVTKRRNDKIELIIYPSAVQGIGASKEIIKGIDKFNSMKDIDVIILARGGGSIEELWAFNDEELGRAISKSKVPIITGIGHEIDFTIADFVSDRRAPTPSAAAEIAVFNMVDFKNTIEYNIKSLNNYITNNIKNKYNKIELLKRTLEHNSPEKAIVNEYKKIESLREKLNLRARLDLEKRKETLGKINALLNAHNPLNVLNKGYSIIQDDNNRIISDINLINDDKSITIIMKNGSEKYRVKRI
ncbi:exodeoxyribonuclease VII large subunit [Clostridium sp. MSJ-11]|uniref:Exodeoxyribonuclease 7 large subunit n=1 Tax=Clostridium mobile TaxID=2841512 RepID=A0ABS6ECL9_9CLOT|nr:exodeoxyribonuclease VII large subunit [Clostridium mobile]MBU5482939.1 exodeoxyribonuclease VII large subunit [Clostridium mobile]